MENISLKPVPFFLALAQLDLLSVVEFKLDEMKSQGDPNAITFRIFFEKSQAYNRYDVPIIQFAAFLSIPDETIDQLFSIGKQIQIQYGG